MGYKSPHVMDYSLCNAYKLICNPQCCHLQCTVVLVGVVLKDSLSGSTF